MASWHYTEASDGIDSGEFLYQVSDSLFSMELVKTQYFYIVTLSRGEVI
jgi:hypothetical protein